MQASSRESGHAPETESSFFAGGAAMRPDRGAVDHLQCVQIAPAVGQRLQHDVPYAGETPTAVLPPDRIPVAELLRKVTPRCTGATDPKNPVEHPAMVSWRTSAMRRGSCEERLDDFPLLIRHQA